MHIDLKPENTLFVRGRLSGVVDFDNPYTGPLILDLANTLMWFCSSKGVFDVARARTICRAFVSKRIPTPAEKAALFDAYHYAVLSHVLMDIYLEYSKDYPSIRIPESYMLWGVDNLLSAEQRFPLTR
ncbi:hypothetical protein COU19_02955 [Candidatus Kaiserbacteria bacterium CG10_big_fil_rev_8_21_14_0_10_56_12]|uniref:Aminoglycoside phosphotransferase domain-containing protein n=1 Tax=Candidatus Kaiserbacteria bacterium CG10_big_fil_rev_8_21_14_0_10_56_12 TaxID=1974611 RepID=A0A2H0U9A6_9BACT|nr:MAG: hypothetical protein COU19_02955 [Candidatus Kaiserbacteria bacterium CG10_big_fil_rev_8_21_14_0_10_56_12]